MLPETYRQYKTKKRHTPSLYISYSGTGGVTFFISHFIFIYFKNHELHRLIKTATPPNIHLDKPFYVIFITIDDHKTAILTSLKVLANEALPGGWRMHFVFRPVIAVTSSVYKRMSRYLSAGPAFRFYQTPSFRIRYRPFLLNVAFSDNGYQAPPSMAQLTGNAFGVMKWCNRGSRQAESVHAASGHHRYRLMASRETLERMTSGGSVPGRLPSGQLLPAQTDGTFPFPAGCGRFSGSPRAPPS